MIRFRIVCETIPTPRLRPFSKRNRSKRNRRRFWGAAVMIETPASAGAMETVLVSASRSIARQGIHSLYKRGRLAKKAEARVALEHLAGTSTGRVVRPGPGANRAA